MPPKILRITTAYNLFGHKTACIFSFYHDAILVINTSFCLVMGGYDNFPLIYIFITNT
jgi:hypothetical protein